MGDCRKIVVRETKLIGRTDIEVERKVVRWEGDCDSVRVALWPRFDALLRGRSRTPSVKPFDDGEYRVGRTTHRW